MKQTFFLILSIFLFSSLINRPSGASPDPMKIVDTSAVKEDRDLNFKSLDSTIRFSATLSTPVHQSPYAAVIIVSGSGKQDRDGDMAGHLIFVEIARYLSARGVAVLRVDDRGTGKSGGEYETATSSDFADDALAAVAFLKKQKGLATIPIGLLGHSEGGAIISIAAGRSTDVKFLVSLAGLATNGLESQISQNKALVAAAQIPDYDKRRFNDIDSLMFETAYRYAASDSMEDVLHHTYNIWKKTDSAYFETLHVKFDHFRFPIYSYATMATGKWYRYFIRYDAASTMALIKVPVLALNGDKDVMVPCRDNLKNWKVLPALGGNQEVDTMAITGVNHLFLTCKTGMPDEYSSLTGSFSLTALTAIDKWLTRKFLEPAKTRRSI